MKILSICPAVVTGKSQPAKPSELSEPVMLRRSNTEQSTASSIEEINEGERDFHNTEPFQYHAKD